MLRVFPGPSFPRTAGGPAPAPEIDPEEARAHVEPQPPEPLVAEPAVDVVDEPPVIEAEAETVAEAAPSAAPASPQAAEGVEEEEDLSVGPGNVATPENEPKTGRGRRTPRKTAAPRARKTAARRTAASPRARRKAPAES